MRPGLGDEQKYMQRHASTPGINFPGMSLGFNLNTRVCVALGKVGRWKGAQAGNDVERSEICSVA